MQDSSEHESGNETTEVASVIDALLNGPEKQVEADEYQNFR